MEQEQKELFVYDHVPMDTYCGAYLICFPGGVTSTQREQEQRELSLYVPVPRYIVWSLPRLFSRRRSRHSAGTG